MSQTTENPAVSLSEIAFVIRRRAEQLAAAGFESVVDVALDEEREAEA